MMEEREDFWIVTTIRVGDVEISHLIDPETHIYPDDEVHMVFYDPNEKLQYAAYGAEEIFDFMSKMNDAEWEMWDADAREAVRIANEWGWL